MDFPLFVSEARQIESAGSDACDRTIVDEVGETVGRFGSAAKLLGVIIAAELAALRRVNAPEPDARAVNFERVAVDNAGAANDIGGEGRPVIAKSNRAAAPRCRSAVRNKSKRSLWS